MPFTPEEREAAFKRLSARYNLDNAGGMPKEGIVPTPMPTEQANQVRAMNMDGDVVMMDEGEARKKGFYILPR